jgi:hypothetical protein
MIATIMFVSDLRQVGGFLRVLRFPPPIKVTAHIRCKSSNGAMVTFNGDTAFFKSYNNILHYIFGLGFFLQLQYNYIYQFMQSTH